MARRDSRHSTRTRLAAAPPPPAESGEARCDDRRAASAEGPEAWPDAAPPARGGHERAQGAIETWARVESFSPSLDASPPKGLEDALPVEGDLVGGLYRLVKLIGEGMFGRVYVAERTDVPEHKVALKVIRQAVYAQRNVERELVMLAAASHPHIVQLKDHGTTPEYVWLTMPLLQGETLGERLERGTLTLREAHDLFLPIARGVEALHAAGLRHQDIKPDNIFLARFAGRIHPMLLDLGVAAEHNATFVAGTVMFAAPEQVMALSSMRDGPALSAKLDTYCLASTLLRSLVGTEHFPGETADTPFELASAFVERETKPLRDEALPGLTGRPRERLEESLRRWLAYAPDTRPTMGELAAELDVLLDQEREIDAEIERARARQKTSLNRIRIAAVAMLVVVLGASGLAYAKRETLRLAAELERAKAGEAESFDQLDTCVAAHRLSQRQVQRCETEWQSDRDEFKATLDAFSETESKARSVLAMRLANYAVRLRGCEENARKAEESWTIEKDGMERSWQTEQSRWKSEQSKWQSERTSLQLERDERAGELQACQRSVSDAMIASDECREDLAVCIQDRDTCLSTAETNAPDDSLATSASPAVAESKPREAHGSEGKHAESKSAPRRAAPSAPAAVAAKPPTPSTPAAPPKAAASSPPPAAPPAEKRPLPPAEPPSAPATAPAPSEPRPAQPPSPSAPSAPADAPRVEPSPPEAAS